MTNVLVLRTDKVGDLILSTPAIRCLREALPDARITLVATPYNAPVVEGSPHLDEVLVFDPSWPLGRKLRFALDLRSRRFDLATVLSPRTPAYLLGWLSGAATRAGIVYPSRILSRAFSPVTLPQAHVPEHPQSTHEVRQMLDVLTKIGLPTTEYPLEVFPSSEDHQWAGERIGGRPLIGIHLAEKWRTDGWSTDDLLRLARAILDRVPGSSIVATCGPQERWAIELPNEDRITMIGEMTFGQWAAVFSRCDAIVSPDTGSLHLAAAVGKPVVALYSVATFDYCSVQWSPWKVPHRTLALGPAGAAIPEIAGSVCDLLASTDLFSNT